MTHHVLKTDPAVFEDSYQGKKPFEIRWNDRDFKEGDTIELKETTYSYSQMINIKDPKPLLYTGRTLNEEVSCVLHGNKYGLLSGWVILGLCT